MRKLRRVYGRDLTLGNLCDLLAERYGGSPAWRASSPLLTGYGYNRPITYRELLSLINRVSVALIKVYRLRKGERVLVLCSRTFHSLVVSLAAIRAGGLAVPLDAEMEKSPLMEAMGKCKPALLVTDRLATGCSQPLAPGALEFPSLRSIIAIGGVCQDEERASALEEEMKRVTDFFFPYTLKPQDVIALSYAGERGEAGKGVMVTSRGVISVARLLYPLLRPLRFGEGVVSGRMGDVFWLAGAVSLLLAGLTGVFSEEGREKRDHALGARRTTVYLGGGDEPHRPGWGEICSWGREEGLRPLLWVSPQPLRTSGRVYHRKFYNMLPIILDGHFSVPACSWLALRLRSMGNGIEGSDFFRPLPHLRYALSTPQGVVKRGRGELLVKGRPVTHGIWGDLEGTYRMLEDGWLHTGVEVNRSGISRIEFL